MLITKQANRRNTAFFKPGCLEKKQRLYPTEYLHFGLGVYTSPRSQIQALAIASNTVF